MRSFFGLHVWNHYVTTVFQTPQSTARKHIEKIYYHNKSQCLLVVFVDTYYKHFNTGWYSDTSGIATFCSSTKSCKYPAEKSLRFTVGYFHIEQHSRHNGMIVVKDSRITKYKTTSFEKTYELLIFILLHFMSRVSFNWLPAGGYTFNNVLITQLLPDKQLLRWNTPIYIYAYLMKLIEK